MAAKLLIVPKNFNLRSVILSHGWSGLQPFSRSEDGTTLSFALGFDGGILDCKVSTQKEKIKIEASKISSEFISAVRYMLRLEDPIDEFYAHAKKHGRAWIAKKNMGRMLRAQTIFEDLMKLVLTTNCSWSFTVHMVNRLIEELGEVSPKGQGLFPTPEAFLSKKEKFYREKIRAGYRSPHFPKIAKMFIKKEIDTDSWFDPSRPTLDIRKEILSIPGAGPYVADNLFKLIGRYDYLGIDSWVRKQLGMNDKQIQKAYEVHGKYKGLILWCDVTKEWLV